MKTFADPDTRREVIDRLRRIDPQSAPRWGRMSAPQMVAHLSDQMSHCLGEAPCAPVRSIARWAPIRYLSIYWIPWPRGRLKGPPDAFLTRPQSWSSDLALLVERVERFGERDLAASWPDHGLLGRMSGTDWGYFCYKHFNHHLRQFGR